MSAERKILSGGTQGPAGLSAYAVALKNGFVGSEAAWLASLQGADGQDGQDGADGAQGPQGPPGISGAPEWADTAAALAGGVAYGEIYKNTTTGKLTTLLPDGLLFMPS